MAQAVAKNEKVEAERLAPEISPKALTLDASTQMRREWFVRLPDGFIAADLSATHVWAKVQDNRLVALRKHDKLYLVAYDETWAAEAIVSDANATEACLSKPRIFEMQSRVRTLMNDGKFRVEWRGTGYVVVRNIDNHDMTFPVQSLAVAERELAMQYPRPAA